MTSLWNSFRMFLWLTILTGIAYPLVIFLIAKLTMNDYANGSLILKNNAIVGSTLIGQKFESDKYFWSRPSAHNYNPLPSGGSNLGPTSVSLKKAVQERQTKFAEAHHVSADKVPSIMVYASGSGLDPHITPKAARLQIDRVVKARGWGESSSKTVEDLVDKMTEKRDLRIFGEPRVNVLRLNMALDDLEAGINK